MIKYSAFPNMYRGYIKLWRKMTTWGWYKDSNTKALFLHLLFLSNHKKSDFLGHPVNRGQCVIGRKSLAKTLGMSERNIRTALKHLKATNEVTSKAYNKFSIVTITKYDFYQLADQRTDQQATSKRPASDQQATTSKEYKNEKNDKNVKNSIDDFPHLKDSSFKELWDSWIEIRKIKKVPNTSRALKIALGKLQAHPLKTAIQMLEKAIEGGWRGIYEPRVKEEKKKTTNKYDNIGKEV